MAMKKEQRREALNTYPDLIAHFGLLGPRLVASHSKRAGHGQATVPLLHAGCLAAEVKAMQVKCFDF